MLRNVRLDVRLMSVVVLQINNVGRLKGIYTLPEHVKVEKYDCF